MPKTKAEPKAKPKKTYTRRQKINRVGLIWHLRNEKVDQRKLCKLLLDYIGDPELVEEAKKVVK